MARHWKTLGANANEEVNRAYEMEKKSPIRTKRVDFLLWH